PGPHLWRKLIDGLRTRADGHGWPPRLCQSVLAHLLRATLFVNEGDCGIVSQSLARLGRGVAGEAVDDPVPPYVLDLTGRPQVGDFLLELVPRVVRFFVQSLEYLLADGGPGLILVLSAKRLVISAPSKELILHANEDRMKLNGIIKSFVEFVQRG